MAAKHTKRSRILEAVEETMADLRRLGFIDKRKQQGIEALVLKPIPRYTGRQIRALRERFPSHAKIARITFPLWAYVSVTGVVVYLMLYQM